MSTDNKSQFNLLTRKVIEMLVEACPVSVEITAETFSLPEGQYDSSSSSDVFITGFYTPSAEEHLLNSTLKWLADEGFIRETATDQYVATLRTLKLYDAIPSALSE
ncbi:hypothetical protein [Pseudomonas sp. 3-2]|uniref:hypothetical protein n=1 Tax=Pseudomonas sp. 3-2 TaxID=2867408 RepID=UPI001C8852D3|nr:hypothetical protein [Pseudomonas sp. 3-2]QZD72867.1 hypothetical protein K3819_08355 [Pseudomonas sp. 3-2]